MYKAQSQQKEGINKDQKWNRDKKKKYQYAKS